MGILDTFRYATPGNDTINGNTGNDTIFLLAGNDIFYGASGDDYICGGLGNDILFGGGGNDAVTDGLGRDEVHGGAGDDKLTNYIFEDNFSYSSCNIEDGEIFDGGDGVDTIVFEDHTGFTAAFGHVTLNSIEAIYIWSYENVSTHAWFLASQVGTGLASNLFINATGNVQIDFVMENLSVLDLSGFFVLIDEYSGSKIMLIGDADNETMTGTNARDMLFGNDGNDILKGGAGNDRLDGGAGNDTLTGGTGDDEYYVDNANDKIIEIAGEGNADTVFASVSYALAAGAEIEFLRAFGATAQNGITLTGNEFNNFIMGEIGNDTLNGGAGDDTLDGYYGNDTLNGGTGNDTVSYLSTGWNVTVSLAIAAVQNTGSAGFDKLVSIENLIGSNFNDTLTGSTADNILTGGLGDDTLNGGAGNDRLDGGDGNDKMNGGAGIDIMNGGLGDDIYYVDNALDQVIEDTYMNGSDRVYASVNYTLGSYQNIEYLLANAGTAGLTLSGNELNNTIYGNAAGGNDILSGMAGNDIIDGKAGDDILDGGEGNDRLTGGTGRDTFVFNLPYGGIDTITDFSVADDTMQIKNGGGYAGFLPPAGALAANAFRTGTSAASAADRFIYNAASGALYYDQDGTGAASQFQIAQLTKGLALTSADFVIV